MSRLLVLVVPAFLSISACSSPPSDPPSALAAGFKLDALYIVPELDAAADPAARTTESIDLEAAVAAPSAADSMPFGMNDRHVTVLVGVRSMDDDGWDPVDDQLAGGLEFDMSNPETGHGFEIGYAASSDEDDSGNVDDVASTFDIYTGYRHTFQLDPSRLHPYVGAGLALLYAERDIDRPGPNFSDDDTSAAAYVRLGFGFDVDQRFRVGLDYRHLFNSDVDIGSVGDADFDQIMLTLGFAF